MAVAEMSLMTLVALSADKSAILDALQRSGAVQIRSARDHELVSKGEEPDVEQVTSLISGADNAVSTICSAIDLLPEKQRPTVIKDGFGVTRAEFFAMRDKASEMGELIDLVGRTAERRSEIAAAVSAKTAEIKAYEPYLCLKENFSFYKSGRYYHLFIGVIPNDKAEGAIANIEENGLIARLLYTGRTHSTIAVVAYKDEIKVAEEILSASGYRALNFDGERTAKEAVDSLLSEIEALRLEDEALIKDLAALSGKVKDLKLYADYLNFLRQKLDAESRFGVTDSTFVMEAYVPTEAVGIVKDALKTVIDATFTEFSVVARDEFAPTLNKNGKVVENFEVVTNMYSSPAYGALDPNAVMSFFFSLFMGVIMADVGYGLLMVVGGFIFASKQIKGASINRMAKVFAFGGFFAVIFGLVFDSWLGFPLFRNTLGEEYNAFYAAHIDQILANTSLAGIKVPAILMWCLGLGTVQMAVGLILKAVQSFGRGRVLEGVFGGLVWAIALFALVVTIYGMCTGAEALSTYGTYVLVGAVAVGVLTAGIGEKGFGIVIKTFSSAYGLINYVSDILSYARLYGLMLSGAQIASIFTNTLAIGMLFPLGPLGVAAGVVLIIVGNVFNLAINLLGAYIHDARLQYVEFFGKFYEGEGELFAPFGGKQPHTYFKG